MTIPTPFPSHPHPQSPRTTIPLRTSVWIFLLSSFSSIFRNLTHAGRSRCNSNYNVSGSPPSQLFQKGFQSCMRAIELVAALCCLSSSPFGHRSTDCQPPSGQLNPWELGVIKKEEKKASTCSSFGKNPKIEQPFLVRAEHQCLQLLAFLSKINFYLLNNINRIAFLPFRFTTFFPDWRNHFEHFHVDLEWVGKVFFSLSKTINPWKRRNPLVKYFFFSWPLLQVSIELTVSCFSFLSWANCRRINEKYTREPNTAFSVNT